MNKEAESFDNFISSMIEAYDDCRRHKSASNQYAYYREIANRDIPVLCGEIINRTYYPSTSTAFCVKIPKVREIFAANFRDRIVQHWCTIRIEPLLEERFVSQGDVSYNCRKNYGVQLAVRRLADQIYNVSDGYTKEAWIGKYDIRGFFMHIDKNILWAKLEPFIREKYHGEDIDILLWLLRLIIFHCPQNNCVRHGDLKLWDILPKDKSLFNQESHIGMPIGNITSQLLANFYMSFLDEYMLELCEKYCATYIRFVDDFVIVTRDKKSNLRMRDFANEFLINELHIELHPEKSYLQEAKHGVKFIGSVIKPHRIYTSNRTIGNLYKMVYKLESFSKRMCMRKGEDGLYKNPNDLSCSRLKNLNHIITSINSLTGFTKETASFNIRKKIFSSLNYANQFVTIDKDFRVLTLRDNFTLKNYYLNKEIKDYAEPL